MRRYQGSTSDLFLDIMAVVLGWPVLLVWHVVLGFGAFGRKVFSEQRIFWRNVCRTTKK